jgi:chromosome segregation ATPase
MVTLEQIRLLEAQVDKALKFIDSLKDENELLKMEIEESGKKISALESTVKAYKDDQGRIEEGILNALNKLNQFEDTLLTSTAVGQAASVLVGEKASVPQAAQVTETVIERPVPSAEKPSPESPFDFEVREEILPEDEVDSVEAVPAAGELDIF